MALLRMISFAGAGEGRANAPKKIAMRERPAAGGTSAASAASERPATAAPSVEAKGFVPFDGDWPALVARLNLTGMAGIVARNSELVSFGNGRLELVVTEAHRVYADRPYTEKLHAELAREFGPGMRLSVRVGEVSGKSVAAQRSREDEQRRETAAEAIEADPFVRELVRDLGAEVVASSIKPPDDERMKR